VPDPEPEIPVGSGPPTDPVLWEGGPGDPLIPEIIMGSPARQEVEPTYGRSLSPMARFAAADPQIMGVLQDIIGSLRGLERRMVALEKGRARPSPDPRRDPGGVDVAPAPRAPAKSGRRRKRRKKGERTTPSPIRRRPTGDKARKA